MAANEDAAPITTSSDTSGSQSDSSDVLTQGAYIDPTYKAFAAEEAFRGVCSIAISDILFEIENSVITNTDLARPVNSVYQQEFTSPPQAPSHNKVEKNSWFTRIFEEPEKPLLATDAFYPIADPILIERTGIEAQLGVHKNAFGLYILDGQFIPLVRFVDQRHLDSGCSYADLNPQSLNVDDDALIVTANDEKNSTLGIISETDWNYHVAIDVLEAIEIAFRLEDERPLAQRVSDLDDIFDFESVVRKTLNIEKDIDTATEVRIREAIQLLRPLGAAGIDVPLVSREFFEKDDPSTSFVLDSTVTFGDDGGFTINETISHPLAADAEPKPFSTTVFSPEIGSVTLFSQALIDDSYETAVGHVSEIISYDSRQRASIGNGTESIPREPLIEVRRRNSKNYGVEDRALEKIEEALGAIEEYAQRHRFEIVDGKVTDVGSDGQYRYRNETRIIENSLDHVISATTGIDSPRAWEIRDRFWNNRDLRTSIIESLAGIDTPRAWEMREKYFLEEMDLIETSRASAAERGDELKWVDQRANRQIIAPLLTSLAGIDSYRAWEFRNANSQNLDRNVVTAMSASITGLDSQAAWDLRRERISDGRTEFYDSLAGLESDEAQQLRQQRHQEIKDISNQEYVHRSELSGTHLIGSDNKDSRSMRKDLDIIQQGEAIRGLDTKQAWKIRYKLLERYAHDGKTSFTDRVDSIRNRFSLSYHPQEMNWEKPNFRTLNHRETEAIPQLVLDSLVGIDSPKAIEMRQKITELRDERQRSLREKMPDITEKALDARSYVGDPTFVALQAAQERQQITQNIATQPAPAFGR